MLASTRDTAKCRGLAHHHAQSRSRCCDVPHRRSLTGFDPVVGQAGIPDLSLRAKPIRQAAILHCHSLLMQA